MKPILMIHEFKKEFLNLPLENYTLTFDDGLYTQYLFLDELRKIKTDKFFFISSNIVCSEDINQDETFINSIDAHKKAFNGVYTNYMKWSQIKEIDSYDRCNIGCHSHFHSFKTADCVECIILDNRHMIDKFEKEINYLPKNFCFPYNYETPLYREILTKKGFTNFFGKGRIDIIDL